MVILQSYFSSYNYQQDERTYYDCWITLQTALKIAANNLYCKITFVWLDSSLSVGVGVYEYWTIRDAAKVMKHIGTRMIVIIARPHDFFKLYKVFYNATIVTVQLSIVVPLSTS